MANLINADPTNGLKLISDSSSEIQLQANGVTKATLSSAGFSSPGHVLQVVQGSNTTQLITTSTSYVDSGLSASITPSSTSSKILVIVSHPTCEKRIDDAYNSINFRLLRGSTVISSDPIAYGIGQTATTALNLMFSVSFNYLDSPSTTSAITYKTQIHNSAGTGEIKVQRSGAPSTITLIEVAG